MLCKCGLCRHALSVCPSVRLSVTIVNSVSVKMSNRKLRFFSRSGGFSVPNVMAILRRDPTPLTVASKRSNADGIVRNRDSEKISGFIACCQRCDRLGVINTAPPDGGKLWHLSLVLSGGVCWWRQTTSKCLWQEVSQRYVKDNRTSFNCTQWQICSLRMSSVG